MIMAIAGIVYPKNGTTLAVSKSRSASSGEASMSNTSLPTNTSPAHRGVSVAQIEYNTTKGNMSTGG